MATVLLVRHGETEWNRERRLQGWAPTGLTDRGHEQASDVGDRLVDRGDVGRLVASDLRRTRETVDPIARRLGLDVTFEAGWRERDFGRLQGVPIREAVDYPGFGSPGDEVDVTVCPPSGESIEDARVRVLSAWADLCADLGADEVAVVVTHGGPIRAVVGSVRALDLGETMSLSVPNCSTTTVRLADGRPAVVELGSSPSALD